MIGVDIEPLNVARANNYAAKAGISDRLSFGTVDSGNLLFEDESLDIVFSKDAIIEVPNKEEIFSESYRVLRPDGSIALGD